MKKLLSILILIPIIAVVALKIFIHTSDDAPLRFSAENGYIALTRTLLLFGANPHAENDAAAHLAADNDHAEILEALIDHGVKIDAQAGTIIVRAINNGNAAMLKVALERGNLHLACASPLIEKAAHTGNKVIIDIMRQHIDPTIVKCTPDGKLIPSANELANQRQFANQVNLIQGAESAEAGHFENTAVENYRKAAEMGSAAAQNALGIMLSRGEGIKADPKEGLKWLKMAADQDDAAGDYNVGYAYQDGIGTEKDYGHAWEYFRRAADGDYPDAYGALGGLYWDGKGVPQDPVAAISWFSKAAQMGSEGMASTIGYAYDYGLGVTKDTDAAIKWYEKDLSLGFNNAVAYLGWIYLHENVPDGPKKALSMYEKEAAKGNVRAIHALGSMYLYGWGVPKDVPKALDYYLKAADDLGKVQAASILFNFEPKDYHRAFELFSQESDAPVALNNLGFMYEHGLGIPNAGDQNNLHKAYTLYKASADKCYGQAMYHIGKFYETGSLASDPTLKIPKDIGEARRWMRIAANYGSQAAAKWLKDSEDNTPKGKSDESIIPQIGYLPEYCSIDKENSQ